MEDPIQHFEAACAEKGAAVTDVLSAAGVAPSTYWRWRSGRFEPRPRTLRKLHETLDALSAKAAA